MADKIKIEVLPSGIIKVTTDKIAMPNHSNSEGFLRDMARLAGGKITRTHRHGRHSHTHNHEHDHNHEGH